ncbi:MAG: hydantoinase B/oxoprolinase family protein, partial [Thermoanaerobaculia bacterium]|nr:hydantoinase B/oxoprolinase family protein [Thermoanaerobaculia bacterium]
VAAAGVPDEQIRPARFRRDLRYRGQATSLEIEEPADGDWAGAFEARHRELYGHVFAGRGVEVAALRVEVVGEMDRIEMSVLSAAGRAQATDRRPVYFEDDGWLETDVYERWALPAGARWDGPALVAERTGATLVEPGWSCEVTAAGDLALHRSSDASARRAEREGADPVDLEVFNNHFAAIAEEMGTTLRRTALSVNVKERLDFSCAVFDGEGGLVANAPHMPVHLGAMGETVRCVLEDLPDLGPGDVVATNDPFRGGSHLPDVTVVTPVFGSDGEGPRFFTASRAHHAEIGGIRPGSMPPDSRTLAEEGVLIRSLRVVAGGEPCFDELRRLLTSGPWPSRSPDENVADVEAQIAANQLGVRRLEELMADAGEQRTLDYMAHIQRAAADRMRASLAAVADGTYARRDRLDNGATIAVAIRVAGDRAEIDFTGTSPPLDDNLNANLAIVKAAVIYSLRCLIEAEIPLNQGVLDPVRIRVPRSLLDPPGDPDPARCPAVVGGNVETSQRVTDVVLGALGLAAASQGTMNNLSFGDGSFGYYETICGGAGAGPGFRGADAVHTHMTNTRLTDPEVLEAEYPVRLVRFEVRRGSGGAGRYRGGDGCRRELEFLAPLEVSILSQRRTTRPFGLEGGEPGEPGRNRLLPAAAAPRDLPGVVSVQVAPGDRLLVETPGGGGYGPPESPSARKSEATARNSSS